MVNKEVPLVSIITPSFNQGQFIEATIKSVVEQDYPRIEYIIIDGGSTDNTLEIIHKYEGRIDYWVSEDDQGQTDAINKGFSRAKGDIIAWLNSDDTYEPHAISQAVEFLSSNPDVGMVYGSAFYIDEQGRRIGKFPSAQTDYARLLRGYVHIPQQAAFFRKKLWDMVGPLDTHLFFAMDYDLWVRIASIAKMVYTRQNWANFRIHSNAKTIESAYRCWPEMVRVANRYGITKFSAIYLKFIIRTLIEPVMPLRLKLRTWLFSNLGRQ